MANMALGFAELLAGVVLLDSAITKRSIAEVVKGAAGEPAASPAGNSPGPGVAAGPAGGLGPSTVHSALTKPLKGQPATTRAGALPPARSRIKAKPTAGPVWEQFFATARKKAEEAGALKKA